jgi:hypothetical protein
MTDHHQSIPWSRPGWLDEAGAWIRAELARNGLTLAGPIEQPHIRPWSTVLRVPTGAGDVYFKATSLVLAHEPALTDALGRWHPDCIPALLAVDAARGWMLMPDLSPTLRVLVRADRDLRRWEQVLASYAGLQIDMAARRDELLALGALDRRLATLPAQFAALMADPGAIELDREENLTSAEYARLREMGPQLAAMCERLAGYGIPETLHHDDFHDGNIFWRDGRALFFDWGESCVAHPFFTMTVTLRSIAYSLELDEQGPEIARLRDVYLEPWERVAPRARLLEAFPLARRLGMFNRALTWHRVVSSLPHGPEKAENADAVPGWLQEFLLAQA